MTREEVQARVVDLFVQTFELAPEKVVPEARLAEDLDLDSIDAIDMVVKLQDMTGRRVEEAGLRKVRTVRDVVDLVEQHVNAQASA